MAVVKKDPLDKGWPRTYPKCWEGRQRQTPRVFWVSLSAEEISILSHLKEHILPQGLCVPSTFLYSQGQLFQDPGQWQGAEVPNGTYPQLFLFLNFIFVFFNYLNMPGGVHLCPGALGGLKAWISWSWSYRQL